MYRILSFWIQVLVCFYLTLSDYVTVAEEVVFANQNTAKRKGYIAGDIVPVTCLNRTIDTGEHVSNPMLSCFLKTALLTQRLRTDYR